MKNGHIFCMMSGASGLRRGFSLLEVLIVVMII